MKNRTRFSAAYLGLAACTVGGLLVLTACGGGSDPKLATGYRDDVKYLPSQKAVAPKTHTTSQKVKKTKKVCVGTGYKKSCTDKADGTKTVKVTVTDKPGKPARPSMYCVEIDALGGDADNNDQWFEVSAATYLKWAAKHEGDKVDSMPYLRSLPSCKR